MDQKRTGLAWLTVALLLLPALYVGSYWALVRPLAVLIPVPGDPGNYDVRHYARGGAVAETLYWPLEQVDRRLRPAAWYAPIFH
jgi:hypothetical protein